MYSFTGTLPPSSQDGGSGDGNANMVTCEDAAAEPDCYDIWDQASCAARSYCAFLNNNCYDRLFDAVDMTCPEFTDADSCGQIADRCAWNYAEEQCGSLPCGNFSSDVWLCQSQVTIATQSPRAVLLPASLPAHAQNP